MLFFPPRVERSRQGRLIRAGYRDRASVCFRPVPDGPIDKEKAWIAATRRGVSAESLAALLTLSDGRLRVVLDDVRSQTPGEQGPWQHEVFVTFKDYERGELAFLGLSDDELAAFGHYIRACLLAVNGLLPPHS